VDKDQFSKARVKLNKTQKEIGDLLGASVKAVQSYEQGWRVIPAHVERQLFFLLSRNRERIRSNEPCWTVRKCPSKRKNGCPAWEFHCGDLCWFINGTVCEGRVQRSWDEKMEICRSCEVLVKLLGGEPRDLKSEVRR
jgi:hypothetical protein